MSIFPNSRNVKVTGGSFQAIAGDQHVHINVQRDNPLHCWRQCIEIFDIVDSGKHYEIEYEIVRVKLEVERIRLLEWGNAVGFGMSDKGTSKLDPRLERDEFRGTVLRLMGCIHHIFEEAERLQERYGLRPVTPNHEKDNGDIRALPLASIFKRAYEQVLNLSKDRRHNTPFPQRNVWAIRDKKKFQEMIYEIKGFNDSLDQLFPDVKKFASENMKNAIDSSEDVEALQSLQEATTDDHDDISEIAGDRLEAMGATTMAGSQIGEAIKRKDAALGTVDEEDDGKEVHEMVESTESFVKKMREGRLRLSISHPTQYSATATAYVYWEGQQSKTSYWDDHEKGFLKSVHPSFDFYYKKKFTKPPRDLLFEHTKEGSIFFDVESHPKHQNVNPGTVTVEGFGMECWSYEIKFGKPRNSMVFTSAEDMPSLPAKKLLRRVDELRRGLYSRIGWNPSQDEANLREIFGEVLCTRYESRDAGVPHLDDFYRLLNRRDFFADFTSNSSIIMAWSGPEETSIGRWNFLWQMILAKELAIRIESMQDIGISSGFTHRVLASLMVQDQWLRNVEIILTDAKLPPRVGQPSMTASEKIKAEALNQKGNQAMKDRQWQKSVNFYSEALDLDRNNAIYFSGRSAALLNLERYEEALIDAYTATQLDPRYAKAWSRLGLAEFKIGNGSRAQHAYERAIQVSGEDSTALIKQGLADAKAMVKAQLDEMDKELDPGKKDVLRKNILDQNWDITCKSVEFHSLVHQQQVEGLLLFAERMGWPYLNEVRDYAEDVYGNLLSGQTISCQLHDWLYGMMLPGSWMSFKIMATLVLCTPSISASLDVAAYFDCGVSLPKKSYWRVCTVLGRVLGCLPNVISLCGWIGPCLIPVEFIPPLSEDAKKKPRYVHLNARSFSPITRPNDLNNSDVFYTPGPYGKAMHLQPDEDLPDWIAEIKDNAKWVYPQPPQREFVTCTIDSIQLKKLPPEVHIAAQTVSRALSEEEVEKKMKYRASIVFSLDNATEPVTYTLYTNPVFVTVPPCHFGPHQTHIRELPRYQKDVWMVDRLKDHIPEDLDDDVMIINATGKGTEVLARAWCAERGKSAVIRRMGGPCFVCAVGAAGNEGLGVGVLIWVS